MVASSLVLPSFKRLYKGLEIPSFSAISQSISLALIISAEAFSNAVAIASIAWLRSPVESPPNFLAA